MKKILFAISFLILFGVIYIAVINFNDILSVSYLVSSDAVNYSKSVKFGVFTSGILLSGIIFGSVFVGQFYFALQEKFKAYKRELERSSITNSSGEAKINVLEAKIVTLEKALNDALNK